MLGKLTVFDWISPLIAEIQDIANGPSHTFLIDENITWSGREIARMLERHGVKSWGHMIVDGYIMITVRQPQAGWAAYLLEREGLPVHYGMVEGSRSPHAGSLPETSRESSPDVIDQLLGFLGF